MQKAIEELKKRLTTLTSFAATARGDSGASHEDLKEIQARIKEVRFLITMFELCPENEK